MKQPFASTVPLYLIGTPLLVAATPLIAVTPAHAAPADKGVVPPAPLTMGLPWMVNLLAPAVTEEDAFSRAVTTLEECRVAENQARRRVLRGELSEAELATYRAATQGAWQRVQRLLARRAPQGSQLAGGLAPFKNTLAHATSNRPVATLPYKISLSVTPTAGGQELPLKPRDSRIPFMVSMPAPQPASGTSAATIPTPAKAAPDKVTPLKTTPPKVTATTGAAPVPTPSARVTSPASEPQGHIVSPAFSRRYTRLTGKAGVRPTFAFLATLPQSKPPVSTAPAPVVSKPVASVPVATAPDATPRPEPRRTPAPVATVPAVTPSSTLPVATAAAMPPVATKVPDKVSVPKATPQTVASKASVEASTKTNGKSGNTPAKADLQRFAQLEAELGRADKRLSAANEALSDGQRQLGRFANTLRQAMLEAGPDAVGLHPFVKVAEKYAGTPYVWGGESRSGFDCSGMIIRVMRDLGYRALPHSAAEQFNYGKPIAQPLLKPGDLVFFANTYKAGISHVGIYLGKRRFIHAAGTGKGTIVSSLDQPKFQEKYAGARRLIAAH